MCCDSCSDVACWFFAVKSGKLRWFAVINLSRASFSNCCRRSSLGWRCLHRGYFATATRETTGCLPERAGGRRVCVWTCHSELSDVDVSRSGMTAALYEGGMAQNPDMVCVCVCVCVWWTALADMRWRGCHAPRTLTHTHTHTHTNTNIHIQRLRAWMVIQLQPAVWKQVKGEEEEEGKGEDEGWSLGPKETRWARLSSSLSWWVPQANILWMRAYFGGLHFPFYPSKEEVEEKWLTHDVMGCEMNIFKWVSMCIRRCEFWPAPWSGTSVTVQHHWFATISVWLGKNVQKSF